MRRALAPLDDPARVAAEIARADRPRPALAPAPPAEAGSRDRRHALRPLRRRLLLRAPAFTAIALLTLALASAPTPRSSRR